jgi:hypothetical protein
MKGLHASEIGADDAQRLNVRDIGVMDEIDFGLEIDENLAQGVWLAPEELVEGSALRALVRLERFGFLVNGVTESIVNVGPLRERAKEIEELGHAGKLFLSP